MPMQAHTDALPLAPRRAGGRRRRRPQRGPAKTAVMSPNSIRLKSGETPSLLTTMEGPSPWRAPGSPSTSSPPSTGS